MKQAIENLEILGKQILKYIAENLEERYGWKYFFDDIRCYSSREGNPHQCVQFGDVEIQYHTEPAIECKLKYMTKENLEAVYEKAVKGFAKFQLENHTDAKRKIKHKRLEKIEELKRELELLTK